MNRFTLLLSLLAIGAAGCGDNADHTHGTTPDAAPADAGMPRPRAVAVTGDFEAPGTGVISRLDTTDLAMQENVVAGVVQGDPTLRRIGDKLYVINRFGGNNITILDANTLQLVEQLATGANSNPHDVAVVGDKLYVPALGTAGVLVLTRGSTTIETIDLSALQTAGQADQKPDCISAYAIDDKVYVACGLLDGFNAVEVGKVAVIDTATDTLVTSVAMTDKNPYGLFERAPASSVYAGDLLLPTVPDFISYATGCVQRVSVGATPTASCGVTNQELGGFANRLAVGADDGLLYVAVGTYDASYNETGKLKAIDLATGMVWSAPLSTASELITDVAVCANGDIVATDKTLNAGGLRVWRETTERTTAALSIGMPPKSVNALTCYDAP